MSVVGFLPLKLILTAPAVVTVLADPVRAVTGTVIPGRVLQGLLAAAAGAYEPGDRSRRIREWVLQGQVQVGPAFGAPPQADTGSSQRTQVHPAPLSWHSVNRYDTRSRAQIIDLLDGDDVPEGASRLSQIRAVITSSSSHQGVTSPVRVDTAASWHQQRNRTAGRPVEATGGPFEMLAIAAGQVFTTSWRLTAADPRALSALLDDLTFDLAEAEPQLRIGTAGTTRYGGGLRLGLLDPVEPLAAEPRLDRRHTPTVPLQDWPTGTQRDILLISPALIPDGACRSAATAAAVQAAWGGPDKVDVVCTWVEHLRYGGYNSTWRSPVTEQWATAAGSVIRLQAKTTIPAAQLYTAETTPIGIRTAEGTGRHLMLLPQHRPHSLSSAVGCPAISEASIDLLGDKIPQQLTLPDGATRQRLTLPDGATTQEIRLATPSWTTDLPPASVSGLQHHLFLESSLAAIRVTAAAVISPDTIPPAHLLSRLTAILTAAGGATQALQDLRAALPLDNGDSAAATPDIAPFAPKARHALDRWVLLKQPATQWLHAGRQDRTAWWALFDVKPLKPAGQLKLINKLEASTLDCWTAPAAVPTSWLITHDDYLAITLIRAVLTAARRTVKDRS